MELRDLICDLLQGDENFIRSGMKATELIAMVALKCISSQLFPDATAEELIDELELLIQQGEIIEIEYVVPKMGYHLKSFLLPKGTQICDIRGLSGEQKAEMLQAIRQRE